MRGDFGIDYEKVKSVSIVESVPALLLYGLENSAWLNILPVPMDAVPPINVPNS